MERKALLAKLEICAPALSTSTVIPVLQNFAFTGTQLMTHDDKIGIVTPFKTEFKGTLPGATLLNLVRLSRAKEVEFMVEGNDCIVKMASTKLKLPIMPLKEFTDIFTPPPIKENKVLPVKADEFIRCINMLMRSVSEDTSDPNMLGITLIPTKGTLNMYSINNATLSRALIRLKAPTDVGRACISKPFCEQMLILAKDEMGIKFEIEDDHATLQAGPTTLVGKLVYIEQPTEFAELIEQHFPTVSPDKCAPLPTKLRGIIDRALVVADSKGDSTKTRVVVKEGRARFITESELRGQVVDSVQMTEEQGDCKVGMEARHVKKGIDDFDKILFTARGIVMAKDNIVYLISPQD